MAEIHHLENRHDVIFSDLNKISETGEWPVDCGDVVEIETRCRIAIWRAFGRIQWHVIPLGKFTVTIPEPHATLQAAVTWRNQYHDRATLQGVRIPSAIIENCFSPYFIFLGF